MPNEEIVSPYARRNEAPHRDTEGVGKDPGASFHEKASETHRQRGRPKGSRNKAKPIITPEILLKLKGELTPNDYEYLRKVVMDGEKIDVHREAQIMLTALGRNILPILFEEAKNGEDEEGVKLRRDVTERLKVWNSLAGILHNIEKHDDPESDSKKKPIFSVFERSGADPRRIRILIDTESDHLGRSVDGVGGSEDSIGAVSREFSEGSFDIQDSEQGSPVGNVNSDFDRDDSRGSDETEL